MADNVEQIPDGNKCLEAIKLRRIMYRLTVYNMDRLSVLIDSVSDIHRTPVQF